MRTPIWISLLFWLAAIYDGVLGAVFFAAPLKPFEWFGIEPPNHPAYVQFPALLLIVFMIMFVAIAVRPVANRHLIIYGILLKAAFVGVALGYWLTPNGIPNMWKPFVIIDTIMAALFAAAYSQLGRTTSTTEVV